MNNDELLERIAELTREKQELQAQYEKDMQGVATLRALIYELCTSKDIDSDWIQGRGFDAAIYHAIMGEFERNSYDDYG